MESLLNADLEVFNFINGLQLGFLDTVLIIFRNKMTWIPLYVALVVFMIWYWKKKFWLPLLFTLLTVACADFLSSEVIKKNVERPRPCQALEHIEVRVTCGTGYSFTSSHATSHMALAVFWVQLFTMWGRHRWWFVLWALIVGFAQIFVGVHYPVDVLSGFLLGGIVGYVVYQLYKLVYQKIYPRLSI